MRNLTGSFNLLASHTMEMTQHGAAPISSLFESVCGAASNDAAVATPDAQHTFDTFGM